MDFYGTMKISSFLVNLVYLYVLLYPDITVEKLFKYWKKSKIFKDYNKPDINTLKLWFADIYDELEEKGIKMQ